MNWQYFEKIPVLITKILNDAVLGFLALLSLFLILTPGVFALTSTDEYFLSMVENLIILVFIIEYTNALLLAKDRSSFVRNPWRIIDALIIFFALVAILPFMPDVLRNSPMLRLFRLGRFALLGTRSGLALKSIPAEGGQPSRHAGRGLVVRSLGESGTRFDEISLQESLEKIRDSSQDWLFFSGIDETDLGGIAEALRVPEKALHGIFLSTVPRFARLDRFTTLYVRYPLGLTAEKRLRRAAVLLVGTADNVVVLCREHTDLEQRVETRLKQLDPGTPRMTRALTALVSEIIRANTEVLEGFEISLAEIEVAQPNLNDKSFLARTFDFRADLLKVRSSLKYLKNTIREISEGSTVTEITADDRDRFRLLSEDVADLFEGIEDIRESLQSLVDLRLNVASFQMNRVMRLLALLTTLALVPATAGGLLGMNLADAPWPGTLLQVAFCLAAGMSFSLYLFAVKGWFR